MVLSLTRQKRSQPEVEAEVDPNCCCAVCFEVLLDPVTLPCGHSLDQRCLQRVVAAASGGTGRVPRACPTCRKTLPTQLPEVSVQLRSLVQWRYPLQVARRRADLIKEAANESLETAFSTLDVVALRRSAEADWRSEQDAGRLRPRVLRTYDAALSRAQRELDQARASDTTQLKEMGLKAVRTASRDTLCAMAVQAAVQDGADVNTRAHAAQSWLWHAVRDGMLETVRALLEAGADVNHENDHGFTSLHLATENGHLEALCALLEAGANVNHTANNGATPLYVAAENGHLEALRALLEAGADVDSENDHGATPLHLATMNGHLEALCALLEAGANVNHADEHGWTALYMAAHNGHLEVLRALLEAGADVNHENDHGFTSLHLATENGHLEALCALLEAGANVNHTANNGATPLYVAAENGHLEALRALLQAGADLDHIGIFCRTPLEVARAHGHEAVARALEHETEAKAAVLAHRQRIESQKMHELKDICKCVL